MSVAKDIQEFSVSAMGASIDRVRDATLRLTAAIIKDTPVDTGALRGNWQVSQGEVPRDSVRGFGGATLATQGNGAQITNLREPIYITNTLPYAVRIEYGWSKQAPAGMVRRNLPRFTAWLQGPKR